MRKQTATTYSEDELFFKTLQKAGEIRKGKHWMNRDVHATVAQAIEEIGARYPEINVPAVKERIRHRLYSRLGQSGGDKSAVSRNQLRLFR